jgi:hypothetical protein
VLALSFVRTQPMRWFPLIHPYYLQGGIFVTTGVWRATASCASKQIFMV